MPVRFFGVLIMMNLYSGTTCPFSQRCRIVLYEKGMDFQVIDVDLFAKPEDIAMVNPYGRVPVLVERDLILYEPNAEVVFDAIVPEYLAGLVYGGVCESTASELAARRMAMDAATSNAEEMIDKLNLYYNRARQASITQEITEIVAGAEGL